MSPTSCNIGALIIRIGFGAHYTIIILRNPQNSIGNYLGGYITSCSFRIEEQKSSTKKGGLHCNPGARGTLRSLGDRVREVLSLALFGRRLRVHGLGALGFFHGV